MNLARVPKTFHGVTINPMETKDVPGYINDKEFVRVDESSSTKVDKKQGASAPSAETKKSGGKVNGTNQD